MRRGTHLLLRGYSFSKTKSMDPHKDEFEFTLKFAHMQCNDACSLDLEQTRIWRAAEAFTEALERENAMPNVEDGIRRMMQQP